MSLMSCRFDEGLNFTQAWPQLQNVSLVSGMVFASYTEKSSLQDLPDDPFFSYVSLRNDLKIPL
jgi:hypothetical protein